MAEKLFTEFPPVTAEQWDAVIVKDLKGADYEKRLVWKSPEGFNVRPFYSIDNLSELKHLKYAPGEFPYVRGICKENKWKVTQTIDPSECGVKKANTFALDILMKGVDSLNFKIENKDGLSDADFNALLSGISMPDIETNFKPSCSASLKTLEQVIAIVKAKGWDGEKIKGSINFDPLRRFALKGAFNPNVGNPFEYIKCLIEKAEPLKNFRVIAVSPYIFHNAGSSIVQELAFGLAMGNEYLAKVTELGLPAGKVARRMKFTFAVSSNYFMEIAKFRAARMLWSNIVKAYDSDASCAAKMRIHAVTSAWNQSVYDPYVNMLRGTTEAMSAALAGVDSMEVTPFDAPYRKANEFSARMSRNTQLILKEESYFDRVTDPAAGSYYIETLTNSIAEAAWALFKQVEEKGGYLAAMEQGFIQKLVKETAQKRDMNIATRREILLGTNQYPNFTEKQDSTILEQFSKQESCECTCGCGSKPSIETICQYRGAVAFEELRMKTERSKKAPIAFMLTFGNLAMARARAQFACNFFACAGFEVVDNNLFASVEEGVKAAIAAKASIVVACSSDDDYAEGALEINKQVAGKAIVTVAGDPACRADLESKGVTHFINVKSNVLETLKEYQKELGI